jgi:hypothetical protein
MRGKTHRTLLAILTALVIALGLSISPGALSELPPRPEPSPSAPSQSEPRTAGLLLRATYPANWPWTQVHWQTPWTVVQWQDAEGDWHDVEGWQGPPTLIIPDTGNTLVGLKAWGVAPKDFDTGPFRWIVYADRNRATRLATSATFDLPGHADSTRTLTVTLALPPGD